MLYVYIFETAKCVLICMKHEGFVLRVCLFVCSKRSYKEEEKEAKKCVYITKLNDV